LSIDDEASRRTMMRGRPGVQIGLICTSMRSWMTILRASTRACGLAALMA
jgi:hypothetical protein